MKLAERELPSAAVLAPIAGYSDAGFRRICAKVGAAATYTEMVSAKGLVYGSEKTEALLATTDAETFKAAQLFGADPSFIERACALPALRPFDLIDLNMGCPMPKIVKNGEGSALLRTPALAEELVRAARRGSGRPVSVKMRIGYDRYDAREAREFALRIQDAGACAITVHGRTRTQLYSGACDRQAIADIAHALEIPVIANGDVHSADDCARVLAETGAAGVMLARGALRDPLIFADIAGIDRRRYRLSDLIAEHLSVLTQLRGERQAVACFRKHIAYYTAGRRGGAKIRAAAFACVSAEEMKEIVRIGFAEES